jgi:hypothetical protein
MQFPAKENIKLDAKADEVPIVLDADTLMKVSGAGAPLGDSNGVTALIVDWRPKTPGNGT